MSPIDVPLEVNSSGSNSAGSDEISHDKALESNLIAELDTVALEDEDRFPDSLLTVREENNDRVEHDIGVLKKK
jgi:hypothetical protein